MKDKIALNVRRPLIGLVTGLLALGGGCAVAQSNGNGIINVTGSIIGGTCELTTADIDLLIGTVDKSVFNAPGDTSDWSDEKSLRWGACDASLITLRFTGQADANDHGLFAAIGGATGVGIQLAHSRQELAIYAPGDTATVVPAANNQTWTFHARYVRTIAPITTGPANATITVIITYT
jgi:type 1 fimbria pilin